MDEIIKNVCLSSTSSSSSSDSSSSSSSSFFSSEFEEFMEFQNNVFGREKRHRVKNFVTDVVHYYSDIEFRQNFRVSRQTAQILIQQFKISKYFKTKKCGGRKEVSAEVLAFLWFAGNKVTYRGVSNIFNMSISTAHSHLGHVLDFLFNISTTQIKFPVTEEEKIQKSQAFSKLAGIDNTIGCIDGCYIYIRKPSNKIRLTYINRHGLISMTLQGICDADKKFWDVCVGSPSKIHDARIFKLSYISKELPTICGEKYHILGDAAYPLREFLLTPYKDYGSLSKKQIIYNKKHCQTRVKIENAFGLLKQRFRQLIRLDFMEVDKMCKFILGCCVLHNICIDASDLWDIEGTDIPGVTTNEPTLGESRISDGIADAVLKHRGELKRNNITQNF